MDVTPLARDDEAAPAEAKGEASAAFSEVVEAWHARGEPVPVAVVASVFDDALSTLVEDQERASASLEDLRVMPDGAAFMARPASLRAVARLLMEAMGADLFGDQSIPSAAWGLFDRLTSDEPSDGPADAEQLRQWVRESFGALATHEEVRDCVFHALMGNSDGPGGDSMLPAPVQDEEDDVHDLETLPPHPSMQALPVPTPAAESAIASLPPERSPDDHQVSTDVVRKREQPRENQPDTDVERATHLPEPLVDSLEPNDGEDGAPGSTSIDEAPPSAVQVARRADDETAMPVPLDSDIEAYDPLVRDESGSRPVVRHTLPHYPRPVSVGSAPAARRSARSSPYGGDSLIGPADQKRGWVWVGVAATICAAVYLLFFR